MESKFERAKRTMLKMYQDCRIEDSGELFCKIRDLIQTTSFDFHEQAELELFNIDLHRAKVGR